MAEREPRKNDRQDEERMEKSGARRSGYHEPSKEDVEDIKHDHNTAAPGAVTADEAVREARGAGELRDEAPREEERPKGETSFENLPSGVPKRKGA